MTEEYDIVCGQSNDSILMMTILTPSVSRTIAPVCLTTWNTKTIVQVKTR